MKQPQRYTGPELGPLLREVRAELGEQATIHEANRIREGGVAGFFRREAFEVLASSPATVSSQTLSSDTAVVSWESPANEWLESDDTRIEPSIAGRSLRNPRRRANRGTDLIEPADILTADDELVAKLTAAMESEQAWAESIGTTVIESAPPPADRLPPRRFSPQDLAPLPDEAATTLATALLEAPRPSPMPTPATNDSPIGNRPSGNRPSGNRLLERADSVSTQDRVGQLLAGAQELINDRSLARRTAVDPNPVSTTSSDDGIPEPSIPPRTARAEATQPDTTQPNTTQPDTTQPNTTQPDTTQADITQPDITQPNTTQPDPHRRIERSVASGPPRIEPSPKAEPPRAESFWADLTQLESFLPVRPTACANVQLLVGPLDVAMPLASRFANDSSVELHVLSDEVQLVGVEQQQMAETSRDLSVRLARRTSEAIRAVGVIEADDSRRGDGEPLDRMLPPRLLTLIDRICADGGVDLIRLTLRSLAPIEEMTTLVQSFPVPCAIDLATAPAPAVLDAALAARLPIVSVAGRQLTPALAMALKQS